MAAAGAGASSSPPFRFRPARLRFPAHHPFFEDGDVQRHLYLRHAAQTERRDSREEEEEEEGDPPAEAGGGRRSPVRCHVWGCAESFGSLGAFEHHYALVHRSACAACRRPFPSRHLLDLHLLERHGALFQMLAQRQSMFQCLVESCPEKFKSPAERKEHLVAVHRYPPDFRFDKTPRPTRAKERRPQSSADSSSSVPMDLGEQAEELPAATTADVMEAGPSKGAEEAEAPHSGREAASASFPESEMPLYRSRVPATICFGQGAPRAFVGRRRKT